MKSREWGGWRKFLAVRTHQEGAGSRALGGAQATQRGASPSLCRPPQQQPSSDSSVPQQRPEARTQRPEQPRTQNPEPRTQNHWRTSLPSPVVTSLTSPPRRTDFHFSSTATQPHAYRGKKSTTPQPGLSDQCPDQRPDQPPLPDQTTRSLPLQPSPARRDQRPAISDSIHPHPATLGPGSTVRHTRPVHLEGRQTERYG